MMEILKNVPGKRGRILNTSSGNTHRHHNGIEQKFIIRNICPSDNEEVKNLIRRILTEIGGKGEGSPYNDAELEDMYAAYTQVRSAFFVLIADNTLVGTIGIAPLSGTEYFSICELRKLYLHPACRGMGLGARLLATCLEEARQRGYQHCYLETHTKLKQAVHLYEKNGFHRLSAPLGHTGHTVTNLWYIKTL